jgi:acetyl-CoA carboxylase biotin carboxylase subunit
MQNICEGAAKLLSAVRYAGAATCEFLMDRQQNFYMLEVNTRVQVEHPVTEMITGVDIVQMSIRIAAGEKIPYQQGDIRINGHAIECRINAEDPEHNFRPSAGKIEQWFAPGGLGVRMDTHAGAGYAVPPNYDSMIAKLICHAATREKCIDRTLRALREFTVAPIKTTIPLQAKLMQDANFRKGGVDIHYLERLLKAPH